MKKMSRRDLVVALSAVAATSGLAAEAQTPASPKDSSAQANPAPAPSLASPSLASARVFKLSDSPTRKSANGGESADVVRGTVPTGESIGLHETVLPPGASPSPLHRINHSELILVREGAVAFEHDGKTERAGPGDAIYVAYGTLHAVRNVGDTPAKYFVVGVGGDMKR